MEDREYFAYQHYLETGEDITGGEIKEELGPDEEFEKKVIRRVDPPYHAPRGSKNQSQQENNKQRKGLIGFLKKLFSGK